MTVDEMSDKVVEEIEAGKFAEALKTADEIITAYPEDIPEGLWFVRGLAEESLRNLPAAIDAYTKATTDSVNAWYRLGNLLVIAGQFAAAVPVLKKAFELVPELHSDAAALSALSWALNETGEPKAALEVIDNARKSDPKLLENGQLELQEGIAWNALKEWQKALEALAKAAERIGEKPALGVAWLQQGLARQNLNDNAEAVKCFAKALDLPIAESVRTWVWIHLSRSHIALGDKAKAGEALDNATALARKSIPEANQLQDALLANALAHQNLEEHDKAISLFQEALAATQPNASSPKVWLQITQSYVALKDLAAANEALDRAEQLAAELIKDPPSLASFRIEAGRAQQDLGNNSAALRNFEGAVDGAPDDASRAWLMLFIARNHIALNDRVSAQKALDKSASKSPSDANFLLLKAELSIALNHPKEALADIEVATKLNPRLADAWSQKVGLLINFGHFAEALTAVDNALDCTPETAKKAFLTLARANVLTRLREFSQALTALDEAARLDPQLQKLPRFFELKAEIFRGLKRDQEIPALFEIASVDQTLAANSLFVNAWATALMLAGKDREGFEKLQEAMRDPLTEDASEWLVCGTTRGAGGLFKESLEALERAAKIDPTIQNLPGFLGASAAALSGLGKFEEALKTTDVLVEIADADPGSHMLRGTALAGLGKHREALDEFDKTIERGAKTELSGLYECVALIQRGWVLVALKDVKTALASFIKAAGLAEKVNNLPNRIVAFLGQGVAFYLRSTSEKKEEAEASQAQALAVTSQAADLSAHLRGPVPALAWMAKGHVLSWLEREEEALIAYQRATMYPPEAARLRLSLGESHERLEDYEAALKAFESAREIAAGTEKSAAYLGMARAQHRLERYEESLQACREAIATTGESEEILELLGTVYMKLERYNAALTTFRRGRRLKKAATRSSGLALGVSAALLAQNQDAEARSFLESAQKDTNFTGRMQFNYGVALYRLKDYGAAAKALRKAANMGVPEARDYADKLEGVGGPNRTWFDFWFGSTPWARKTIGVVLSILLIVSLLPSLLKPNALGFLPWLALEKDWKVMLIPIILASAFLLLPILRRVSVKGMEFDISQPQPQVGLPDVNLALKAFLEAGPNTALMRSSSEQPKI